MATYNPFQLTRVGRELEYKAQTGQELKFTKFKLGSGTTSSSILDLTQLVEYKMDAEIKRLEINGTEDKRKVIIGFDLANSGLNDGFYLREIGIFAQDPDTQEDTLVFYSNAGDTADYIPPKNSDTALEKLFNAELYISNIENITAEIDTSLTYVSQKEYTEKITTITEDISEIQQKLEGLAGAYVYKGSKANREALPPDGNTAGDVYNLEDTGMNVAWNGAEWDDLGGTFEVKYESLPDKPSINGVKIENNKQCEDYEIQRSINYMQDEELLSNAWIDNQDGTYYYLVSASGVTANHVANVYLDLENQQKLTGGYTETTPNFIKIITSEKPTENITCSIEVAMIKQNP